MINYKSLQDWLEELGKRESSGRYDVVNSAGYMGKYQMGEMALADSGYYQKTSGKYNNDWSGYFTGKDNVYTKEDFLNNHEAQENAIREFKKKQWSYLQNNGSTKAIGSTINGIPITESGLLSGAHLVGHGETAKYINSNGKYIPMDQNKVSIEEYIKKFGGYDISEITDPNYYAPKFGQTKGDFVEQRAKQGSNMISQVAQKVNPQPQMTDSMLKEIPIQAPLSDEEWMKRLRRQRAGLL